MPHRFEAFHRPFTLPGGLMRVLGAIVEISRLPVGNELDFNLSLWVWSPIQHP